MSSDIRCQEVKGGGDISQEDAKGVVYCDIGHKVPRVLKVHSSGVMWHKVLR